MQVKVLTFDRCLLDFSVICFLGCTIILLLPPWYQNTIEHSYVIQSRMLRLFDGFWENSWRWKALPSSKNIVLQGANRFAVFSFSQYYFQPLGHAVQRKIVGVLCRLKKDQQHIRMSGSRLARKHVCWFRIFRTTPSKLTETHETKVVRTTGNLGNVAMKATHHWRCKCYYKTNGTMNYVASELHLTTFSFFAGARYLLLEIICGMQNAVQLKYRKH